MNQTVTRINRIPMPKPEEIGSLPPFMNGVLDSMKGSVPFSDYKNFSRLVVDLANGELPAMRKAGIKYANPKLQAVADSLDYIGEYNPDKLPVQTYEKMRLDPQISIALALIKLPIIAQNFRIDSESEQCASLANAVIRPIYRKLLQNLLKHIDFGFAVGEKEYDQKKMKISKTDETGIKKTVYDDWAFLIKRIKFAHPISVRIIRDKKTEEIKYVTQNASFISGTINLRGPKKIRIKKCVWHAPSAEYGNFFGTSRLKAAYQPWYWSQVMLQFMMRYLERRGSPSAYGKAPPGHSMDKDGNKVDNLDIALKTAESLISNSAVAYPAQFDKHTGKPIWEVGLIQDDQRGDMFITALQFLNVLKARGMWMPERTFSSDGGSTNATAESHTDIHLMSEEAEIQWLEETINMQILPDIVEYNFPEGERYPCTIKIDRLTHSRKVLVRDIFVRMLILAAGSIRDGQPPKWIPSIRKMAEIIEIPGAPFDEVFLQPAEDDVTDGETPNNPGEPDPEDDGDKEGKPEDDKTKENTPSEKDEKKKDANKKAPPPKERTRRERRARQRN